MVVLQGYTKSYINSRKSDASGLIPTIHSLSDEKEKSFPTSTAFTEETVQRELIIRVAIMEKASFLSFIQNKSTQNEISETGFLRHQCILLDH